MSRMWGRKTVLGLWVLAISSGGFGLPAKLQAQSASSADGSPARSAESGTGQAQAGQAPSDELRQAVVYMLNPDGLAASITSSVEAQRLAFFSTSPRAADLVKKYPGIDDRMRRRFELEARNTAMQEMPKLQRQYENLVSTQLTPDDIKALLEIERDPGLAQLRDPAFIRSLGGDQCACDISEQVLAKATPQQRVFLARFMESVPGKKVLAIEPQLEALRTAWMQHVLGMVSQQVPAIADSVVQQYQR